MKKRKLKKRIIELERRIQELEAELEATRRAVIVPARDWSSGGTIVPEPIRLVQPFTPYDDWYWSVLKHYPPNTTTITWCARDTTDGQLA